MDNKTFQTTFSFDKYNAFDETVQQTWRRCGRLCPLWLHRIENLLPISVSQPHNKSLLIRIYQDSKQVTLCTLYKPTSADNTLFIYSLQQYTVHTNSTKLDSTILSGECKPILQNKVSSIWSFLILIIPVRRTFYLYENISLIPLSTKPTRISETSSALLKNIPTSFPYKVLCVMLTSDTAEH